MYNLDEMFRNTLFIFLLLNYKDKEFYEKKISRCLNRSHTRRPIFSFFFYVSLEIILDTRSNRLTKELQGYLSSSTINFLVQ